MSIQELQIDGMAASEIGRSLSLQYPARKEELTTKRGTKRVATWVRYRGRTPEQRRELANRIIATGPGTNRNQWLQQIRRLRSAMEGKGEDTSMLPPRGTQGVKFTMTK